MGKLNTAFLCLLALTNCVGAEVRKSVGADLRFVSEVAAVQPGVPFTIALHVRHHPGYHTYWKSPGIVGVPTAIEWTLPKGFQAGPIQWPAPEIVDMATHPAHGYHREVLLLVDITPPAGLDADSVTLVGDLTWMACARDCNPGFGKRHLTLPVNRAADPLPDPKWKARIATARAQLPALSRGWTVTIESKRNDSPIRIRIKAAGKDTGDPGKIYFFSEDGQISSEPPQVAKRRKDGSYLITAKRSEWGPEKYESLPGTLVASGSWDSSRATPAIRVEPRYAP